MPTSYLKFLEVNLDDGRKTQVWTVLTLDGSHCLGRIGWYSPWRRYVFIPSSNEQIILDYGCLREIAQKCEDETEGHRKELREGREQQSFYRKEKRKRRN